MKEHNSLRLEVDKPVYIAGDTVNGVLHVHITRSVKVRTLDIYLHGREKVVIDPPVAYAGGVHKAHYSSTNEMLNVGLRLVENRLLDAGDMSLPFQFHLPPNALPSYVGNYADVNWKLWAKADVPWASDISVENYLRVQAATAQTPSPVVVENAEKAPRLRVQLSSNILEPGEAVTGTLTLVEPGGLRSVRFQITLTEYAMAKGAFTDARRNQTRGVGPVFEFKREQFQGDSPISFQLDTPSDAPSSYQGIYSSISWSVAVVLDIPHSEDIHLYAPFTVGLRRKPELQPRAPAVVAEGAGGVAAQQTKPYSPITEPEPVTPPTQAETLQVAAAKPEPAKGSAGADMSSIILEILGDGGSKDLLTVSTELQLKSSGFVDLNTVRRFCEDLVSQGRLKRTGEGEFFAKYAINAPGPQGQEPPESSS